MNLDGAGALVTGGASGLGLATARALHARGASVVIVDLSTSAGEDVAKQFGDGAQFVAADVTDAAGVQAAVVVAAQARPLRAVVHCAGRGGDRLRIIDKERVPGDLDTFAEVVRTNLVGTYNVLRLAAAQMAANDVVGGDRGAIVLTASVAAFDGCARTFARPSPRRCRTPNGSAMPTTMRTWPSPCWRTATSTVRRCVSTGRSACRPAEATAC
jgi:NAD(P)-dependent dehydrogenase (short-subunit alcohol dehydrogenase family)